MVRRDALMQATLADLQDQHDAELGSHQDAASRQLAAQSKVSERLVREFEAAIATLQGQLAQVTERADVAESTLRG
jgi:hypothetical protein